MVDSNPYSRLMALQRMGIVENYERIREFSVAIVVSYYLPPFLFSFICFQFLMECKQKRFYMCICEHKTSICDSVVLL